MGLVRYVNDAESRPTRPATHVVDRECRLLAEPVWHPLGYAHAAAPQVGLIDPAVLAKWPDGMRVSRVVNGPTPVRSCRCSKSPTAGATKPSSPTPRPGSWPSRSPAPAHARVEDRIRHAKDTGLGRFPSREFKINQAWLMLTQIAADLLAWTRLLALTGDAKILRDCEPKALRYRFLHVPARLNRGARRRLKIPETWPWAAAIVAVFANIATIPAPT